MRSLSSTLLAAQRSASAAPYVRVAVSDYLGDVLRLRWSQVHTGGEGDYYSAVVVAPDGALVRARLNYGAPVTLYVQRVPAPGPTSDFSQWALLDPVSSQATVALAAAATELRLFYVAADGVSISYRTSNDNGATWSAASVLTTRAVAPKHLAAAYDSAGSDWTLFWNEGGSVYSWRSSLASAAAWSNSLASVTGLACTYQGDWDVVVTGTVPSGEAKALAAVYGDGFAQPSDTWSALQEIATAAVGSFVSYLLPSLNYLGGAWRAFFTERYLGAAGYDRVFWSTLLGTSDFNEALWREPVPFDYNGSFGAAIAVGGSPVSAWLASAFRVWLAALPGSATEISADLLEAEATADGEDGSLHLVLRNDDGRYNPASTLLQRGHRIAFSPGYLTPAGAEVSAGLEYWVESLEYVSGERAVVSVRARDGWSLLERWRSRRQFQFAAGSKNVFNLLELIFHRAGLDYSTLNSSSPLSSQYPAFTIHPDEAGRTAVRRLLALVTDRLRMLGAFALGLDPRADDASTYAYTATAQASDDHPILRGRYRDEGPAFNRVQAFGGSLLAERFDFPEIEIAGDRLDQVDDLNLTTAVQAGDRAAARLRIAEIESRRDEIVVRPNVGQEVWDVVEVTDPQAGLAGARRRVLAWRLRYSTVGRPVYEQTLTLGEA